MKNDKLIAVVKVLDCIAQHDTSIGVLLHELFDSLKELLKQAPRTVGLQDILHFYYNAKGVKCKTYRHPLTGELTTIANQLTRPAATSDTSMRTIATYLGRWDRYCNGSRAILLKSKTHFDLRDSYMKKQKDGKVVTAAKQDTVELLNEIPAALRAIVLQISETYEMAQGRERGKITSELRALVESHKSKK